MSDVNYVDGSYCAICDLYFSDHKARGQHIEHTPEHPQCKTCDRRFLNRNTLRNHYTYARHHHYCTVCNIIFNTAAGLKVHIEYAPIHGDDSDEEEDESEAGNLQDGWEDDRGADEFPDEVSDFEGEDDVDNSWEEYDDCDFEDEEDLGDPVNEYKNDSDTEDEEEEVTSTERFTCPMCNEAPKTICTTPCGHLFCVSCIRAAYKYTGSCPACDVPGSSEQLRRLYISE